MTTTENNNTLIQDDLGKTDWKAKYEALVEEKLVLEEKSKSLDKLVEKLDEGVRCPVCLEVPTSSPIYSCSRGHLLCSTCFRGHYSTCPCCRTRMFTNVSLLATIVIENIERACKFDFQGCRVRLMAGELEEHARKCQFRLVSCPSHLCKKEVPFSYVVDHLLTECDHSFAKDRAGEFQNVDKSSCTISLIAQREDLATGLCDVTTISWQGKFFFLNDTATLDNLHRNIYVQMLASKEECKKYKVTVSVEDKMGEHFMRCNYVQPTPKGARYKKDFLIFFRLPKISFSISYKYF